MDNNSKQPLVSIITVVYNGAKTLEQTILSVINQSYKNIEYLIIDGSSTDGTIEIIKKYEDKISFWNSEPDRGLYDAMNKGILQAKGEIIGMINSDDWYEYNAVELIIDAYIKNPSKTIFHGNQFNILEDGRKKIKIFNPSRLKFIYYGMTYYHPSMFIHKDVYLKCNYNIQLRALADYEFVLKQYLTNEESFLYIPSTYVNYRLDGLSASVKIQKNLEEGFIARRNAGLGIIKNVFAYLFRFIAKRMILIKQVVTLLIANKY